MIRQNFDIAIRVAHTLTFTTLEKEGMSSFVPQIKKNQFIGIEGSRITKICDFEEFEHSKENFTITKWLEGKNHLLIPGLVNAHTHLPMTLFRGIAEDAPLKKWLHEIIFPLEAALADAEFCEVGTSLSLLESIRFGTTTVGDMYFHEKAIAKVVNEAGIRAVLAQAILDYPTPDNKEGVDGALNMIKNLNQEYKNHKRIQMACGPHAPYSCSDETLRKVSEFSMLHQLPVLIHVSETKNEVNESLKQYGKRPVERLNDLNFLRNGVSLAHGVHLDHREIEILRMTHASIVHNPESNMKLSSGVAPLLAYFENKIVVGLGTDGAASNNNLNLFTEMDSAVKLQKLFLSDEESLEQSKMTAAHAFYAATIGGAKALGLDEKIGSIEVGKEADLVLINLDHPQMVPQYDLLSLIVYSMSGMEVETVLCAGQVLFHQNNFLSLDQEKILIKSTMQSKKVISFLNK